MGSTPSAGTRSAVCHTPIATRKALGQIKRRRCVPVVSATKSPPRKKASPGSKKGKKDHKKDEPGTPPPAARKVDGELVYSPNPPTGSSVSTLHMLHNLIWPHQHDALTSPLICSVDWRIRIGADRFELRRLAAEKDFSEAKTAASK